MGSHTIKDTDIRLMRIFSRKHCIMSRKCCIFSRKSRAIAFNVKPRLQISFSKYITANV